MPSEIQEQLTKYLTDAHSIEEQALAQLRTAPDLAGDPEAMIDRLEGLLDQAVEASLRERPRADLQELLRKSLADAHALEQQAIQLLEKGPELAGDTKLATI